MKKLFSMLLMVAIASIFTACSDLLGNAYSDFTDNTGKRYYVGTLQVTDADKEVTYKESDRKVLLEVVDCDVTVTMDDIIFDESMTESIDVVITDIKEAKGAFSAESHEPLIDEEEQDEHVITKLVGCYSDKIFTLSFFYKEHQVTFAGIYELEL